MLAVKKGYYQIFVTIYRLVTYTFDFIPNYYIRTPYLRFQSEEVNSLETSKSHYGGLRRPLQKVREIIFSQAKYR
jgi:hypothetical protein